MKEGVTVTGLVFSAAGRTIEIRTVDGGYQEWEVTHVARPLDRVRGTLAAAVQGVYVTLCPADPTVEGSEAYYQLRAAQKDAAAKAYNAHVAAILAGGGQ